MIPEIRRSFPHPDLHLGKTESCYYTTEKSPVSGHVQNYMSCQSFIVKVKLPDEETIIRGGLGSP